MSAYSSGHEPLSEAVDTTTAYPTDLGNPGTEIPDGLRTTRRTSVLQRAWRAKAACTAGILAYYVVGYFGLNKYPFESYHDVTAVPLLDDLPILPWTVVVYNSVFLLGALAIWLLPDGRSVGRYFLSVMLAYTLNFLIFALYPTRIERAPLPEEGSMWLWAMRLTREVDSPYTCFPSLHITNCVLGVIGLWRTRWGPWFLAWTIAIALSTLTTDQHLFLDLPAGAAVAGLGASLSRRLFPILWPVQKGRKEAADGRAEAGASGGE